MRLFLAGAAVAGVLASTTRAADSSAVQTFLQRVNEYAQIRKTAVASIPALSKMAQPADITNHEKALVDAIRKARPNAKPGDLFTPQIKPVFAKVIKSNLSGPANKDSRETVKQGNPTKETMAGEAVPVVQVNAIYPRSATLSSVPPPLLLQLPQLPAGIEYRFVGSTLILLDTESNLIIDYMKEVAPPL